MLQVGAIVMGNLGKSPYAAPGSFALLHSGGRTTAEQFVEAKFPRTVTSVSLQIKQAILLSLSGRASRSLGTDRDWREAPETDWFVNCSDFGLEWSFGVFTLPTSAHETLKP